jgi:ribosomal protein S18 acetylase RimI-like enzyme
MAMLKQRAPLWSPSAETLAARVHRATAGAARLLGPGDTPALKELLARDAIANVSVSALMDVRGSAGPGKGRNAAFFIGVDAPAGGLESACWIGSNAIPVGASAQDAALFGYVARDLRRRFSSIYGPAEAVLALYEATGWESAREVRADQPLMVMRAASEIASAQGLRESQPEDFKAVEKACAAMFTEELGFSPYTQGSSEYRARIKGLIDTGHSLIWREAPTDHGWRHREGKILFKAEFGAVTSAAVQVQGVWVDPDHRGEGLSVAGMAAVVDWGLRLAPRVSLYVNDYNTAALRTYRRVGFEQVGSFATVLF